MWAHGPTFHGLLRLVSAVPDTKRLVWTVGVDEFVLLASDGVGGLKLGPSGGEGYGKIIGFFHHFFQNDSNIIQ